MPVPVPHATEAEEAEQAAGQQRPGGPGEAKRRGQESGHAGEAGSTAPLADAGTSADAMLVTDSDEELERCVAAVRARRSPAATPSPARVAGAGGGSAPSARGGGSGGPSGGDLSGSGGGRGRGSSGGGSSGGGGGGGEAHIRPCPYGAACYRRNPQHFLDFSHQAAAAAKGEGGSQRGG
eukprot:scaffold12578_cov45-Phaeocystis_antarctica.AAC.1